MNTHLTDRSSSARYVAEADDLELQEQPLSQSLKSLSLSQRLTKIILLFSALWQLER